MHLGISRTLYDLMVLFWYVEDPLPLPIDINQFRTHMYKRPIIKRQSKVRDIIVIDRFIV